MSKKSSKIEVEGNVVFPHKLEESSRYIIATTEKSWQVCIANKENKAIVYVPFSQAEWTADGLRMPIWLASRFTKNDDVFRNQGIEAGMLALQGWSLVLAKSVSMRGAAGAGKVSSMAGR